MTADDDDDQWDGSWDSGLPPDHSIEVEVTDNPVVGVILGPSGETLVEVHERPTAFGFARWNRHSP